MLTVFLRSLVRLSFDSFPTAPQPLLSPSGSALRTAALPAGELLTSGGTFSDLGQKNKGGTGE